MIDICKGMQLAGVVWSCRSEFRMVGTGRNGNATTIDVVTWVLVKDMRCWLLIKACAIVRIRLQSH